MMWLFFALVMTSKFTWELWLSNSNKTGSSSVGLTYFMKWSINIENSFSVIHPDLFPVPIDSGGPFSTNKLLYLIRGKMNMHGMKLPMAFTAAAIVTRVPRSADVTAPTCLEPRWAITFLGFCTVVIPVSSTFQILLGRKLCRWSTSWYFSKNELTLVRLKDVALLKLVGSGLRIVNIGFRFMKPANQSLPALPFFFHDAGILSILYWMASW